VVESRAKNVSNLQQTTPDLLNLQKLTERMSEPELSDRQLHNANFFRPFDSAHAAMS
jgi:hypothetical protein